MRAAKAIAVYAVAIVVLGALLAPGVFWLLHPHWVGVPFRRVFDRVILGVGIAGLWPLLHFVGIRSWSELGWRRDNQWLRGVLTGFAVGCASFAIGGLVLIGLGQRRFAPSSAGIAGAFITAVVVALIEETFFRGGLQGALQRAARMPAAICIASAIYSIVHFLKPKGAGIAAESVTWLSGFDYLGQILTRSWQATGWGVGFVTLFLAGCILGLAFARTRALYVSMGIHAGWIFTLKCFAAMTDATGPRTWWGGAALVDNIFMWPILLIVLGLVHRRCKTD